MSQVTPISGGNVRQNTRGTSSNHQPTQHFANKFKYNISRCMRPFSNTMRKECFISKRCRRRQQWNWQVQALNQYNDFDTLQMNHSISWINEEFPNLHNETIHHIFETKHARSKFTLVKKNTPKLNLQHQDLHEEKKHQIYNIKFYVRKKNAKFTTSNFTWEKKTPNLQHQILREKKKRQIYNIKIYVRKKTPNLQHQNLREKRNAKFTTSRTTSRTTLDVCQNTDRGKRLIQGR